MKKKDLLNRLLGIESALSTATGWYPAGPHASSIRKLPDSQQLPKAQQQQQRSSASSSLTSWSNGTLLSELLASIMVDDRGMVKEVSPSALSSASFPSLRTLTHTYRWSSSTTLGAYPAPQSCCWSAQSCGCDLELRYPIPSPFAPHALSCASHQAVHNFRICLQALQCIANFPRISYTAEDLMTNAPALQVPTAPCSVLPVR